MADNEGRPSFAWFWKKGKLKLKGKGKAATESHASKEASGDGGAASSQLPSSSSSSKKQSRRAQVRSAQIRHRQRKANYQLQLERDVTEYRDLITRAETEIAALRQENEAIGTALKDANVDISHLEPPVRQSLTEDNNKALTGPQSIQVDAHTSPSWGDARRSSPSTEAELFGNIDINNLTVTLSMDETMGTPSFNISSNSPGASLYRYAPQPSLAADDGTMWLSRAQEDAAINFILALEHVCWDHFFIGDFSHHHNAHSGVELEDIGHALMATTYCMAHAPDSIHDGRQALVDESQQQQQKQSAPPQSFQWQSSGISLQSLRGLASSLTPGDTELTPVQAWFELAERYPPAVLLDGAVLEALKREFKGVVKCVMYGAAMEREAFESVISRVVGSFSRGP